MSYWSVCNYLERYLLVPESDFQLLSPILVLLWPFRVVLLHYLAILDDPLDLGDHERADAHCRAVSGCFGRVGLEAIVLSLRMSESFR
jgi:hypothetical protein